MIADLRGRDLRLLSLQQTAGALRIARRGVEIGGSFVQGMCP
jgi:hypothetical protein